MRMKKTASLLLALAVLASLALPARAVENNTRYSDVDGHYAAQAIETWSGYGVLQGCGDGAFRPDWVITRAELAAVLDRVMGYQDAAENNFLDLPTDRWYTSHLLRLARQGIFRGNGNKRMLPETPITRQEAFAVLARALELEESGKTAGFADDEDISDWAGGYVASMQEAGYVRGDPEGNIHPNAPITRAEVVTVLDRMAAGFIHEDGTYSKNCAGNLLVNAKNVTLRDMTVAGDLIVTDGVGNGDVTLEKVTVEGRVILRGCGENSFHILPGCEVKDIIVTKATNGMLRLVNSSSKTIPMVFINDGQSGVILDGDALGSVVVNCDTQVIIKAKNVRTVSVTADAKVTVEKSAVVSMVEVGKTASNAALTINGTVGKLTNDANIKVEDNRPVSGSSSGGGPNSGPSGGSSTPSPSPSPSPAPVTEIKEVKLQLLAPSFGEIPDTADVLGAGYTAQTQWLNADGSAPSFLWKPADSVDEDAFTADQAYQVVIVLSPVSGYAFAENLKVIITDGKDLPTTYTPTKVEKRGDDRVVTMVYNKTEHRDPVSGVTVAALAAVGLGGTAQLTVSYFNNRLVDPDTFTYQWYRCDDADGNGKAPIPEATGKEYTVPAEDTLQAGDRYYCCEITIWGKGYLSSVHTLDVSDALDVAAVPVPVIGETIVVQDNGRWADVEITDLLRHKDVSYLVSVSTQLKTLNGTALGGSGVMETTLDPSNIQADGRAIYAVDLVGLADGYISTLLERDMSYSYDFTLEELTVTVTPQIRQEPQAEREQTKLLDLDGKGNFYIHNYDTPDDGWHGPSRDMQLVIQSVHGSPRGQFVDKNDPTGDAVPTGQYPYVDIVFGKSHGDWQPCLYKENWDGEVFIWDNWLTGLETGTSKAEVRCAFYAGNAPDGGMNVYYIRFISSDIIFDLENN